jgi:hypothetical protein
MSGVVVETGWNDGFPSNVLPFTFTDKTSAMAQPGVNRVTSIVYVNEQGTAWRCYLNFNDTGEGTFTWTVSSLQRSPADDTPDGMAYVVRGSVHAVCPGVTNDLKGAGMATFDVTW